MPPTGIRLRLQRIGTAGRYVIIPMDHGLTQGPIQGLVDVRSTVAAVTASGADAVLTHRGLVEATLDADPALGRIVHLNGATSLQPEPNDKRLVTTITQALATGADAVSYHLNVGSAFEGRQLEALGQTVESAHEVGLPVLAMAYPRGPGIDASDATAIAHAVRAASELGVDLIKTAYTDDGFEQAVAATDVPVLIAGGEPDEPVSTLEAIADAMTAGAAGVSIGRSVFQHTDPGAMTAAIAAIVHDDSSVDQARERL